MQIRFRNLTVVLGVFLQSGVAMTIPTVPVLNLILRHKAGERTIVYVFNKETSKEERLKDRDRAPRDHKSSSWYTIGLFVLREESLSNTRSAALIILVVTCLGTVL